MTTYNKPIPVPQGESDFYWEKAKEHELWLRSCNACGKAYFYPRDISPCCFSKDTTWVQASGNATLHTYGIVERPPHPGFAETLSPSRSAFRHGHRRAARGPADADQHRHERADAREASGRHGAEGRLRGHHRHYHPPEVRAGIAFRQPVRSPDHLSNSCEGFT